MLCAVVESVPEQHRIARDLVIAKLREIESALRETNDLPAMEVIQRAISELQADLAVRDQKKRPPASHGRARAGGGRDSRLVYPSGDGHCHDGRT